MDKTMQAALMKDFSAEQMGHKPATWCKQCSNAARSGQGKSCANHREVRCDKCKTRITEAHVCLDFVGHADVRARLCEVDPEWTWTPFEFPGTGSLVLHDGQPVGLWIHLTIGGVSKPGYGSCDKGKAEAMKELIGDAIRNAGLSFGIAWKLWAKGERSSTTDGGDENAQPQQKAESFENATPAPQRRQASRPAAAPAPEATAPPGAETNWDWMGHLTDDLVPAATSRAELAGMWANVAEHVAKGECTDENAGQIRSLIKERASELGLEMKAA